MGNCFSKIEREDHRKRKFNKSIHRKRKFFAGVELVKEEGKLGAEGNFHFSYNLDKTENYTPVEKEKLENETEINE